MQNKTKILFCLQTMILGGVEKELITILKRFDKDKYDIEVRLLYIQDEEIISQIPESVRLNNLDIDKKFWFGNAKNVIANRIKKFKLIDAVNIFVNTLICRGNNAAFCNLKGLPCDDKVFDYAVCYHLHSGITLRYVAERIKARHKIAWIHNDFETTGYNIAVYKKSLEKYERIIAVSDKLRDEFIKKCPQFKNVTETRHNIVDVEEILQKSKEQPDAAFSSEARTKIVTVGRMVEQKGYDIAVKTCKLLCDGGYNVAWYAIGSGDREEDIKRLVKENKLENNFYLLGRKENPYPYIANADLYVQSSRHEGLAITVLEAKALNKYMVCTNFAGVSEQISDDSIGIIVQDLRPESLMTGIVEGLCAAKSKQSNNNDDNNADWEKIEGLFIDEKQ